MEHLEFSFAGGGTSSDENNAIVGVVGSGNLEILIESLDLGGGCAAIVDTSIQGYGPTWERVLDDFFTQHRLSNIRVSINDGGATPAIVRLRLDQAIGELRDRSP